MVVQPTVLQAPSLPTPSGGSSAASSVVVLPVTTTSTVVSGLGPVPTVVVPSATKQSPYISGASGQACSRTLEHIGGTWWP